MTATTTVSTEALELLDLQQRVSIMAALAGHQAAQFVGEPECQRHLGQLEMAREIGVLIGDRIAALTGGRS